jgi:O-antigen/teichoic acid export membrane protein
MGIIRRQSIQNLLFSYGGVALGYLNQIYLFITFLTTVQYGLVNVLLNAAVLFAEIAQMGIVSTMIRFGTYFSDKTLRSREFNFLVLLYPIVGGGLLVLVFFLFKGQLLGFYSEKSPLFIVHYGLIFPIFLFMAFSSLLNAVLNAYYKTVLTVFLKEIFLRLCQTAAILLYALEVLTFEGFLLTFVAGYLLQLMALVSYLLYLGKFPVQPNLRIFRRPVFRLLVNYSLFAWLAQASAIIVNRIDLIMLGSNLAGLEQAAIYTLAMSLSLVIFMPARAVNPIAVPVIAESWKKRDLGGILFVGMWINLDSLYLIIGKPEYAAGKMAFLFLGLAKLFDISTGVNGGIIYTSRKYRYDLWFNTGLVIMVISTNLWLIPLYQATGAAIATAVSIFFFNLSRTLFVWYQFQMQPFTGRTLLTLALGTGALGIGVFLPAVPQPLLDIVVRSAATGGLYFLGVYFLKLSPQLNGLVGVVKNRLIR